MSRYDKKDKRALAVYAAIFLLMTLGISIGGHLSYFNFEDEFRRQAGNQISAIAQLKVAELEEWRRERLGDAASFYNNYVFSGLVARFFENPDDAEAQKQILSRLRHHQSYAYYERLCLLDVSGALRLSIPDSPDAADACPAADAAGALETGEISFLDIQRDPNSRLYISIIVPIFDQPESRSLLGALVFRINPNTYLYPYVTRWPIPSETAETLLVRREGQNVLFLNQVRFEPNAALNLQLPLTRTDAPAVQAVLGYRGIIEGPDYRGEPVLADVHPVPGSPWFLVSKMDVAEVYAPLRQRLWQTLLIVGMAILAAGLGLAVIWRQQRIVFYRAQADAAGALRESEEKFRKAFILSPDAININRLQDGVYVSINNGFTKIMGYTLEEVVGKTSLELNIWVNPQERQAMVRELNESRQVSNLEACFRAKNGDIKYGLMSASAVDLNGVPHIISVTHDITERKQMEGELRDSEKRAGLQSRAIAELALDQVFSGGEMSSALERVAEVLSGSLGVARASIWTLAEDRSEMLCVTLYEAEGKTHSRGATLKAVDFPRYFEAIMSENRIDANDAQNDPRTAEMAQPYLKALGITSMLDAGVFIEGGLAGVVCSEHIGAPRKWHPDEESFISTIAAIVAQLLLNAGRKQAVEALRESEARFRALFEQAAVGVAQLDTQTGRFLKINQKYCDILGYTRQEMLQLDFQTITLPEDLALDLANMQKLVAGEISEFSMEKRYRRRDGGLVWVSLSVSPLWSSGEAPTCHIAVVEDITARKQAEEALEKRIIALTLPLENAETITFGDLFNLNEIQRLQDDFSSATGVASIITQVDGTPITTPSNFCRLCNEIIRKTEKGYSNCLKSDAALGRLNSTGPILQPCMSGGLWDAGAGISVGGKHVANWLIGQVRNEAQTEEKMRRYAREIGVEEQAFIKAFHEVPAMSRDKFERVANALFTLARQLSNMAYQNVQQARFIAGRRQAEEALRVSEEHYRTVVSNAPVVTFVTDEKGIFILSEGKGLAKLGLQAGQVVGLSVFDVYHDYPTILSAMKRALAGQSQRDEVEVQGIVFDVFYSPVFDPQGKVQKVIGVSNDITERKQAENEIRTLNLELEERVRDRTAQLEAANKELEAFSYSVSHDLRAPLRGIDGWSQALVEDYYDQLDEQARQYIARVRSETQRMGQLIDDMLQLSRLTRAGMTKERFDLSAIANSIVERLQRVDPQRQAQFNIQAGIVVSGDSHLLEAALVNLLDNAFKFTSKSADARIDFGETEMDGERVFFVRDNGAGFDMTYAQKLFGAFQRMHKASEFPGTGIGLATVQRIVHRHGGRVWAEAATGQGAAFYFTLEEKQATFKEIP